MNLKLVVASMSILGLVSCPVFAAYDAKDKTHNNSHHKVKHHRMAMNDDNHRMRDNDHHMKMRDDDHHMKMRDDDHRMSRHERMEMRDNGDDHHMSRHRRMEMRDNGDDHRMVMHDDDRDYRNYKGMPCQTEVCAISQETMLMESMTQNRNRAIPNPCNPDWYRRIMLAGGLAVDIGKWGNRNGRFMGENYQRFSLNDVYLNLQAQVNDWVHAFASISYNTATIRGPEESTTFNHVAEFDAAYSHNVVSGTTNALQLEQAFATLANFSVSPVFITVGKQFQDFSRYELHPITESLTQVMSKTLATSVKIGFIAEGFTGSIYAFDDPLAKVGQGSRTTNYGASLGYDMPSDCFGFDLGVGYLYNIIGVNDIAYAVNQFNGHNSNVDENFGFYNKRVSGLAAYADVNSGPFTLGARYTTALDNFNVNDLPKNGVADLIVPVPDTPFTRLESTLPRADAKGAKPWSFGVQAAYGFDAWCMNQNIYIGYQSSGEAAGLLIPKYRWLAGYGIDVAKWTTLAVEWDHDKAYKTTEGGTGNSFNLVTLRAAVKFG